MSNHLSTRQKMMIGVIIIALLPTIGILIWGIKKAVLSPEMKNNIWLATPTPIPEN